jgi:hypothetical protein
MTQIQYRYYLSHSSYQSIVQSNNDYYFCLVAAKHLGSVWLRTCLTRGRFRRDANRSPEVHDGEPAVRNHAAHRALGYLPVLGHLTNG